MGTLVGAASKPDRVLPEDAGFPGLLKRVWKKANSTSDVREALRILLTLDEHVPADVQLRAVGTRDRAALRARFGLGMGTPPHQMREEAPVEPEPALLGELGLTTSGRVVIRPPTSHAPAPDSGSDLVGTPLTVTWSSESAAAFSTEWHNAHQRVTEQVADCRAALAAMSEREQTELVADLQEAALRTAPFVLYREEQQYTNFRDRNTLTGKTLWPGHPECALSGLAELSPTSWSDDEVMLVTCLGLLVRSAGYARIEEANGTQLTLDHVGYLLERTRLKYNDATDAPPVAPAGSARVGELYELATALRDRRRELTGSVQLYREIHGVLMHKIEKVARAVTEHPNPREAGICRRLRERLPFSGETLTELADELTGDPQWLARPHGAFRSGIESLVYETVRASVAAFDADFAMSRGKRSLPALVDALRAEDWERITRWDIADYFCCVVPASRARRHFSDSAADVADAAWSMSSRMAYNSWHFIAGNLPREPAVVERDHFVPPTIPDVAFYSDQHHHGHVATKVRFSIRSPQPVHVLGRRFNGFVDLRLLRCAGAPFDERDLLDAHRVSAFLGSATSVLASLVADGADVAITAFDSRWHWETIAADSTTA